MTASSASPAAARRRLGRRPLIIASHNRGKLGEIIDLVAPYGIAVVSAGELGLPEPDETGDSFRANAEIKALAAAQGGSAPALADDSGLVVPSLDGAPGVRSARWAGPGKDFALAMARIERELAAKRAADRRAHFICVLALAWPDGHCATFEGRVDGILVWPPRGERGFGYDPMFQPDGCSLTFGEMTSEAKHAMSHRADAFRRLAATCFAP